MVSIGKLGAGQERYYLDKVAEGAEDYYSGKGEAEGYWLGDAASELGLDGAVGPDQLVAMLTGRDPVSGEPLGMRHVAGKGPVPGFDLTFSAPKSVSLLWALGGPEVGAEIQAAHADSIAAVFDYLQREACWTRRESFERAREAGLSMRDIAKETGLHFTRVAQILQAKK